jgi:hypothetical protein
MIVEITVIVEVGVPVMVKLDTVVTCTTKIPRTTHTIVERRVPVVNPVRLKMCYIMMDIVSLNPVT